MNLGLDLRGGVHFLMAVDMKAALDKNLNDMVQTFRTDLREDKIRYRSVQPDLANSRVIVSLRTAEDVAAGFTQQDRGRRAVRTTDGFRPCPPRKRTGGRHAGCGALCHDLAQPARVWHLPAGGPEQGRTGQAAKA